MPPKPFYKVRKDAYLFSRKHSLPEERVRQWVLSELLTTYGVNLNDIRLEYSLKVGTVRHRADVVVKRDDKPFIVIETKRREDKDIRQGVAQAVSYAGSDAVRAEYAVYTNGEIWAVKRWVGKWVSVPDIPKRLASAASLSVTELLNSMHEVAPLLHWLGKPVPAKQVGSFMSALQEFLHHPSFLTESISHDLKHGTDNLVSVIWGIHLHPDHRHGTMVKAFGALQEYLDRIDPDHKATDADMPIRELARAMRLDMEDLAGKADGMAHEDVLVVRLVANLCGYLERQCRTDHKFHDCAESTLADLWSLLDFLMQSKLGFALPGAMDTVLRDDVRRLCEAEWINHGKQDAVTGRELFQAACGALRYAIGRNT